MNVLVTDCSSRKALSVVRSLGSKGYKVIVTSDERINMSRFSKFSSLYCFLPNPVVEEEKYLQLLIELIKEHEIDILIPMEDETVELIIKNNGSFENIATLLPDYDTFMTARDKGKTMKKAAELGIPCPETYFIKNIKELEKIKGSIPYPVIIKARISSGSRGLLRVNNKEDLIRSYQDVHQEYQLPIVQQYVTGKYDKVQVLMMLDKNHKTKAVCTYQGIREFPINGGPVTMWKTISIPEIENKTVKFMEALKWVGFAEVEYIVNQQTGEFYLMEVNPRFSANIALSSFVGIDMPLLYTKLALNKVVEFKKNNRFNEYCQWLLPGDLLNFMFNERRFKQEVGYFFNKPKKLHYAILNKKDFKPVIGAILSMFIGIFGNIKNLNAKLRANRK